MSKLFLKIILLFGLLCLAGCAPWTSHQNEPVKLPVQYHSVKIGNLTFFLTIEPLKYMRMVEDGIPQKLSDRGVRASISGICADKDGAIVYSYSADGGNTGMYAKYLLSDKEGATKQEPLSVTDKRLTVVIMCGVNRTEVKFDLEAPRTLVTVTKKIGETLTGKYILVHK